MQIVPSSLTEKNAAPALPAHPNNRSPTKSYRLRKPENPPPSPGLLGSIVRTISCGNDSTRMLREPDRGKVIFMALDYRQAAQEILDAIGGPQNVVSAAHCATRLRLVLADDTKVNQAAVDNATGAKGNFKASGQLQVIYGTGTVNKVFDEFVSIGHISAATKEEAKAAAADQQTNPFMRAIKLLGDVFVPIIPAIVASGLLLGIMSALSFMASNGFITLDTDNAWYQILNLVSNTSFTFLQILIGFSAAKAFGANPYLGAVIGMILINPALQNANTVAAEGVQQTYAVIPGLYSIEWVGYQGHVIPIVIACGILAFVEKRLHKVVPEAFDLFVTPGRTLS